MTLREKQSLFVRLLIELINFVHENEWELTLDEVYRPPETAELYRKQGRGIKTSLHTLKLAADLNLFKDGKFCKLIEDYSPLGERWLSMHPLCRWGGGVDSRHFSLQHGKVKF